MALINMGSADGTILGTPQLGNFYLFMDSNNQNLLTKRDSSGVDLVFGVGEGIESLGWVQINDSTYTQGSPFALAADTDTVLDFNIDSSIDTYPPNGYDVTDFFNDTTNRVLSPSLGAAYIFRLRFKCTPSQNSRVLNTTYSIGTNLQNKIIIDQRSSELRTSGVASNISYSSLIYSLDTFLTNGMQIILNANISCNVYEVSMIIARIS